MDGKWFLSTVRKVIKHPSHSPVRQTSMSSAVAILQQGRDATPSHRTAEIRKHMSDACYEMSEGKIVPRMWQLDVAECLLLGIDCEVIAATGAGKTLPFVLPLLVRPDTMVIILSPLDALELDQVCNTFVNTDY